MWVFQPLAAAHTVCWANRQLSAVLEEMHMRKRKNQRSTDVPGYVAFSKEPEVLKTKPGEQTIKKHLKHDFVSVLCKLKAK